MASTNETTTLKLPLFISTDKPSWLGDWNAAMTAIDTAIGTNLGDIAQAQATATTADTKASAAVSGLDTLQTNFTALQEQTGEINTQVQQNTEDIATLQGSIQGGLPQISRVPVYSRGSTGTTPPFVSSNLFADIMVHDGIYSIRLTKIGANTLYFPVIKDANGKNVWVQMGYMEGNPLNLYPKTLDENTELDGVSMISTAGSGGYVNINATLISGGYLFMYSSATNTTAILIHRLSNTSYAPPQTAGTPGFIIPQPAGSWGSEAVTFTQPYGGGE